MTTPYSVGSDYFVFAAVSGACEKVEWRMLGDLAQDSLHPMGVSCVVRFSSGAVDGPAHVTLIATVDDVDLEPLVLHITTGSSDLPPAQE